MNAVVWEPIRRLEELDKVIDGWFGDRTAARTGEATERAWRPAADYTADAEGYRIHVDLPGVRKEDVEINVEDDVLSVRAQRKPYTVGVTSADSAAKAAQAFLNEVRTGTFQRSFRLAKDADVTAVNASMSEGVLEVRVAKRKEAQPRKIEIKS
jgi:HSP20 family protein